MSNVSRPVFKAAKVVQAFSSPEELFSKLPNRAKSHGYLRSPQVDALRDYVKVSNEQDIAFELPTGTGKTTVGLLIAEWHRRKTNGRVAYLAPTNQLVGQVLSEAKSLGIACADLRGTKESRDPSEVGKYQSSSAVGVTTYSNLFNIKPVIEGASLIVFDDAHGGEQTAIGMWTVRITLEHHQKQFDDILAALRPALSSSQLSTIYDAASVQTYVLVDPRDLPQCKIGLKAAIETIQSLDVIFPWKHIRNKLDACIILISSNSIVIRPTIVPSWTHDPFSQSSQRIYMSATLGGAGDLLRSYGLTSLKTIRAQHPQWGTRYIFAPGLSLEEDSIPKLIASIWKDLPIRRMLMLAPSFGTLEKAYVPIANAIPGTFSRFNATDISDSLASFTSNQSAALTLANRYDGLDLPGDDCRFMLLIDSPSAIGPLERHQQDFWKLGPVLRSREQARITQGMGRCTRDATDYAVILLLGQSMIDSATKPITVEGLPPELQRELLWGRQQLQDLANPEDELPSMIAGLLSDNEYRIGANQTISETTIPAKSNSKTNFDEGAKSEVQFSRAIWDENYSTAYKIGRAAADVITEVNLSGYRAWWLYLSSLAANAMTDEGAERDCLLRGRAIGVNSGFFDNLIRRGQKAGGGTNHQSSDEVVENIWSFIEKMGWTGPNFSKNLDEMKLNVLTVGDPTKFHMGIEILGKCIGAETIRPTGQGDPDVVWIFPDTVYTFEAKSAKVSDALAKKDILQAKGHVDWLKGTRTELKDRKIIANIISNKSDVNADAMPHINGVHFISSAAFEKYSIHVSEQLAMLRAKFSGQDFSAVRTAFDAEVKLSKLLESSFSEFLGMTELCKLCGG